MKIKNQTLITIVLLLTVLLVIGMITFFISKKSNDTPYEKTAAYEVLDTPEGVPSYTDMEGRDTDLLQDNDPKTIIVYSWASWCPACKQDLIDLNNFAGTLDNKDVKILAVNRKEDARTAKRFLSTLPNLDKIEVILDPSDYLFKKVAGYAVPEILVYSKSGELLLHERASLRTASIAAVIETDTID